MAIGGLDITLRPYRITDCDDFLIYAGDEKVTRFTRWNTFTSKEKALSYINNFCIPHPHCRSLSIGDRSIGFVFIKPHEGDDKCRADVGYALAAEYWGQGITTRAVKMAISDGFRDFQSKKKSDSSILSIKVQSEIWSCLVFCLVIFLFQS